MYYLMTRSEEYLEELTNILKEKLEKDEQFRYHDDDYFECVANFALQKGAKVNEIIQNYFLEGYLFHTFNGAFETSISENGLILENKPWSLTELEEIRTIFSNHGKQNIFGLYQGEQKTPIYLSETIASSAYYAVSSPSWFLHFTTGGMERNHYDKEAFRNRDYESCLQNVEKLIKDNHLDVLEAQKVLDFFEKYYQIFKNDNPSILLVPRANFLNDEIPERNLEETDIAYLKRIKNTLASKHLTVKENISPNQILIINYNPNKTLKKDS